MTLILETSGDKAPLDALRESWLKNPNSKLFMPLAEQLRRRGCYGEAIDICKRAKAINPRYISCRVLLGRCFIELGMREEARKELEEVLERDRENVFSLRVMAELLRTQGDLRRAIDCYRALWRISPTDMDAQTRLAEIAQLLDTFEDRNGEAIRITEEVRECERGNGSAFDSFERAEAEVRLQPWPGSEPESESKSESKSESGAKSEEVSSSREFFQRDIRRSDFSKFAQWVDKTHQDNG